jgi:hypothetical protein
MKSKATFYALEMMSRERAAVAKKEMEYWLAEAEEWKTLIKSLDPSSIDGADVPTDGRSSTIFQAVDL